jgi:hypothetical protein
MDDVREIVKIHPDAKTCTYRARTPAVVVVLLVLYVAGPEKILLRRIIIIF